MKIVLGSDHAGFALKEEVRKHLENTGFDVQDFGTHNTESCDYNDSAKQVAEAVAAKKADRGVLICGTGIGMSIQANKTKGVRAALVHDMFSAKATRLHNDSNVLTMGGRIIGEDLAKAIVDVWLNTEFSGDARHIRRVEKIEE